MSPVPASSFASAPRLAGPTPAPRYRRSSTVKAPRKRVFIANMTKFDERLARPAGVAQASHNVAMLGCGCRPCEDTVDFGGFGGNGRGSFNNNGGGRGKGSDGEGSGAAGDDSSRLFRHAAIGALALVVVAAAFPPAGRAAPGSFSPLGGSSPLEASLLSTSAPARSGGFISRLERPSTTGLESASGASRPRSKVLHVPCRGSTLVVPLCGGTASDQAATDALCHSSQGRWGNGRGRVVDAPVQLSDKEARIMADLQYRIRESLRGRASSAGLGPDAPSAQLLSSSAPTRGGGGGLSSRLDRESFDSAVAGASSASGAPRPRSKVLHVPCRGGTLVASAVAAAAAGLSHMSLWQRRRVVEAPVELSEREARMLTSRQNRVRDSVLV
ncbi:hypothetical protein TSOC_008546 [Tetrabaena socialis]|uniref:Uncharacterized protein n=1 Tax=Tetrabaena socialis TaxID=47790 RepID=A0A2J7ZY81_9CHLO|nr:hypothetical protein TSOC_008546 [Tetrabaena socialis]|eukprot:PNH05217.1 hypothetical protein TSOC_008546 [Tetrabaena socialis]